MNIKLKIFLTNWINILVIFIAVYATVIISELLQIQSTQDIPDALSTGFLGGLFAIIFYGAVFWIGFVIAMFLLDFVFMNENLQRLDLKLLIEWVFVSSPFIYWFAKYSQWVFLVAVIAFFISQSIRRKKILKIYLPK